MLAVNQDDTSHSVTVWAVRGKRLAVENTVEVAGKDFEELGQMSWEAAQYRVTVFVDEEVSLANEFHSEQWFNQLDVFIADDGSVELNRARAG
jgi:Fe-S cluster biosynthesis and repair protein YggX